MAARNFGHIPMAVLLSADSRERAPRGMIQRMPIFRLTHESIRPLEPTSFAKSGVRERADLQRLLRANIGAIADDLLIISAEFTECDDSRRALALPAADSD